MKQLIQEAIEARERSYSPYSGFKVGAALMSKNGRIYKGCNVENAAYTPTNCAERSAFFEAISNGDKEFVRIAVIGGPSLLINKINQYCPPCGVCLQVMMEFCDPERFEIILAKGLEDYKVMLLKELLPMGFGRKLL